MALNAANMAQHIEGLSVLRFLREDQLEAIAGFLGDGQGVGMFFKRGTQKPGGVVQLIGETGGLCLLKDIGELR